MAVSRDLGAADVASIGTFARQLAAALAKAGLIRQLGESVRELTLAQTRTAQSRKLEAVGRLAVGMARDFNNLLTVINGYAELLAAGLPAGGPRAQEAAEILRAGRRAAQLTGQMPAFGRRQVLRVELVDPNAVLGRMRNALLGLLGKNTRLELAAGLPPVRVDAGQLEQAVLNIAAKARDAMGDGGKLTVVRSAVVPEAELLALRAELKPGGYVRLQISDTGTGVAPAALQRFFEPYFTTKKPGHGTGLGVAGVYGLVKQGNGHVYVEYHASGGARFTAFLPVAEGEEPTAPGPAGPAVAESQRDSEERSPLLQGPYGGAELLRAVREVLDGRPPRPGGRPS